MYQIGKLQYPDPNDLTMDDFWEAINKATELSIDDCVYAVWTSQKEGSDLLAIVYMGEVFQK